MALILCIYIVSIQSGFCSEKIDIEIVKFENTDKGFIVTLNVTNNSFRSYWFHYNSSVSFVKVYGNILHFYPNNAFFGYHYNHQIDKFFYEIEEIKPKKTIVKHFKYELNEEINITLDLLDGIIINQKKDDFLNIEYINMILLFFDYNLNKNYNINEYNRIIGKNGIVVSKIFKAKKG